jgi:hypothetical protein
MENNQAEKSQIIVTKSFMASGPTLHYSHKNVLRSWFLTIVAYGITCLFWSKIATGAFFSFEVGAVATQEFWRLDQSLVTGISIFEYPWQILVLGLLMGVLAIVPVLISQLMSFEYSLPLILEVIVLANIPGFAICLLISCFAVACRPLRFRSRFIAVALCAAPQLAYWIYFGRARGGSVEPIKMGISFVPWFVAWLDSLIIAGFVLGIGHFTRYKPGLVWIFNTITVVIAVVVFETAIGFDELDYQLYVAKNNPETFNEFHEHNIKEALEKTINNPSVQRYLRDYFYPTDPQARWNELKRELLDRLSNERWPVWFILPKEMDYMARKDDLFKQYDLFIKKRPNSRRMPIVLYYSAMLNEYSPDIRILNEKETLNFYNDYLRERSMNTWLKLYSDFADSPESLEARWRIAKHWAGKSKFQEAETLLIETQAKVSERLKLLETTQKPDDSFFRLFQRPPDSVMTVTKLKDLQRRLEVARRLIGAENRSDKPGVNDRLAQFVKLNTHSIDYPQQIYSMLQQTDDNDPLRDNILLAEARLVEDDELRIQKLTKLQERYPKTDGGMQAMYEQGILEYSMWRQQDDSNAELKKKFRDEAKATLTNFRDLYPDSFYVEQVKKYLDEIPAN